MAWTPQGNISGPQGPQGATGATGATGSTGAPGIPGQRGSTWTTGTVNPSSSSGYLAGDMYMNNVTGDYYQLVGTSWVKQGSFTPYQLARIILKTGTTWSLAANKDWPMTSNQWQIDKTSVGAAVVPNVHPTPYCFRFPTAGYVRVTFNINGGAATANLAIKLTKNSTTVGGNTVFSWSGTSSESAVAATGIFYAQAGSVYYPQLWAAGTWNIITNAFGQAQTAVTVEYLGP